MELVLFYPFLLLLVSLLRAMLMSLYSSESTTNFYTLTTTTTHTQHNKVHQAPNERTNRRRRRRAKRVNNTKNCIMANNISIVLVNLNFRWIHICERWAYANCHHTAQRTPTQTYTRYAYTVPYSKERERDSHSPRSHVKIENLSMERNSDFR